MRNIENSEKPILINRIIHKKGQVWVETVLYTLIGLALIGLVLGFVTPRINEARDKVIVEQAIESLNVFDEKINSAAQFPSNVRLADFTMKRGGLYFDGTEDQIIFIVRDLSKPYSEPGVVIDIGRVKVLSIKGQKTSSVVLNLTYKGKLDLRYEGGEDIEKFTQSATPYKFSITNEGDDETTPENIFVIDISETTGG